MIKLHKGFYCSILAASFWAVYTIVLRILLTKGENAYNALFWISVIGLPFWIYLLLKNRQHLKSLTGKDCVILALITLIGSAGGTIFEIFALKYGQVMNYSFLVRTVILFTFVFAAIFLKEKMTFGKIALGTVIVAGSYLLTSNGQAATLGKGDIFAILTAICFALGNNVFGKMATNRINAELSASVSMMFSFFPIAAISTHFSRINIPQNVPAILLLGIFIIANAYFRFNAYKNASASYVTTIYSLSPVLVYAIAYLFLKESLSVIQITGGAMILVAGIALQRNKI